MIRPDDIRGQFISREKVATDYYNEVYRETCILFALREIAAQLAEMNARENERFELEKAADHPAEER